MSISGSTVMAATGEFLFENANNDNKSKLSPHAMQGSMQHHVPVVKARLI